jgi:hypothetical protein
MIFLARYLYCLLWAGHKGEIKYEPSKTHDSVFCTRCGEEQGGKGWWNVGVLRRLWK